MSFSARGRGETDTLLPQHSSDDRRPVISQPYSGAGEAGCATSRRSTDVLGDQQDQPVVNSIYTFGGVADLVAVAILGMIGWHMQHTVPYHHELIDPDDPTINYPYHRHAGYPNRPWTWMLLLLIPFSVLLLVRLLELVYPLLLRVSWLQNCLPYPSYDINRSPYLEQRRAGHSGVVSTAPLAKDFGRQVYRDTFTVLANAALLYAAVETLKVWTGRLRPDFMDRCEWDAHEERCTGEKWLVADGMKAFPSAHAAYSFGSMMLIVLVLFHTFRPLLHSFLATLLCLLPLVPAFHISATRLWANRHMPMDLVVGALIGLLASILSYGMFRSQYQTRHTRLCCSADQHTTCT